jgi:hypothetical protein
VTDVSRMILTFCVGLKFVNSFFLDSCLSNPRKKLRRKCRFSTRSLCSFSLTSAEDNFSGSIDG